MSIGLDRENRLQRAVEQALIYKDQCSKFSELNGRYVRALKRAIEQRDENLNVSIQITGRDLESVRQAYNGELENILAAFLPDGKH